MRLMNMQVAGSSTLFTPT